MLGVDNLSTDGRLLIVIDPGAPANISEVRAAIHSCLSSGLVVYSKHARQRMSQRGFDIRVVERVLQYGRIFLSDYRPEFSSWSYTAEQSDTRVVFTFDVDIDEEKNTVLVITLVRLK